MRAGRESWVKKSRGVEMDSAFKGGRRQGSVSMEGSFNDKITRERGRELNLIEQEF
jgi:hypothetical protein